MGERTIVSHASVEELDLMARFLKGDASMLRCTVCGQSGCDCWTKCSKPGCKWSYRKGEKCRNPAHRANHTKAAG